jgi:hypothetical protein
MKAKVNFAQIAFAVLCILSGVAFGGLGFLAPAPTPEAAHASGSAQVQMLVHPGTSKNAEG